MPVLLILGVIACAFTLPAAASAQFNRTAAAKTVANRVWHTPCNGHIATLRGYLAEPTVANAAHETEPPGQPYTGCVVTFDTLVFAAGLSSYDTFYSVLLHEVGHLAGYRAPAGQEAIRLDGTLDPLHTRNPKSVMYPSLDRDDPRCARPTTRRRAHAPDHR
ncbi:MAG: hypothetical protein ACR2NB_12025 [Solirubrobacteraceae bacterium]